MIQEIVNFTKNLDDDFKNLGVSPREGLHILLTTKIIDDVLSIDTQNYEYAIYSKKMKEQNELLEKCKTFSNYSWYVNSNKSYDKGIHTASPYCIAFKREFLEGGGVNVSNREKNRREIPSRFKDKYFKNAILLLEDEIDLVEIKAFESFFVNLDFVKLIKNIDNDLSGKSQSLKEKVIELKEVMVNEKDKINKDKIKEVIDVLMNQLISVENSGDYIVFYLDKPIEKYKITNSRYLADKLFNKDDYKVEINNELFGVSGFFNSIDSGGNKPFWLHKTATFEVANRLSNSDVELLNQFEQILKRKTLPNPLPIFIYKDELQNNFISLFKDTGFKLGYKELIEGLWENYNTDFANYYLLNWQNSKDGLKFQDFDFVSNFEYEFDAQVENLFEIPEKGGKNLIHYSKISNVFELNKYVFGILIGSKDNTINSFDDLKDLSKLYNNKEHKFLTFSKYRKAVYDFVYKSKRQGIDEYIFTDMVFSHIKDDLRQNNSFGIKEKLNIWFSLFEKFKKNKQENKVTMASQLKKYQEFVAQLSMGKIDVDTATDKEFAFAAGQIIDYLLGKSQAQDKSYQLLEPYLQQAKCQEFKRAIANDIARYKHAINDGENRFKSVCDFVLTYDTGINMKELMPEILAGAFSKCQFFHKDENKK